MIERPSVRLSRQSTAATAAGTFAAERPAGKIYRQLQAPYSMRLRLAANAVSVTTEEAKSFYFKSDFINEYTDV